MKNKITKRDAAWYLAAMVDGEGCVFFARYKSGNAAKYINIVNTDKSIISFSRKCLDILGIYHRIFILKRKLGWLECTQILISRKQDILKFKKLIPIQCERKITKLNNLIKSYPKRVVLKKEILEKMYRTENKSMVDIAKVFNVDSTTVHKFFQKHGIKARNRFETREIISRKNGSWISKKELETLYLTKRKTPKQIAIRFKLSPAGIVRKLDKFKIQKRSKREAINLYHGN